MKWKKLVPSEPRETETRTACDFCGEDIVHRGWDWSEILLTARLGEAYPETDCRQAEAFDCCPKCWAGKVRPALEALGGKCHEYPNDEGRLPRMPFDPNEKG